MSPAERRPLSRERILSKAIELVDEHGLEALSMRKLGAALGVEAMSLYNHIANKEDVLDGMLDLTLRQIPMPSAELAWTDQVRALLREVRQQGLAHPAIMAMLGQRQITSDEAYRPVLGLHQMMLDAGFGPDRALDAFVLAATFVLGYMHVDQSRLLPLGVGTERVVVYKVPAPAEPSLAFWQGLADQDWDAEFEHALELVLDALGMLAGTD
jgi:AcrR family transcriptional regulator